MESVSRQLRAFRENTKPDSYIKCAWHWHDGDLPDARGGVAALGQSFVLGGTTPASSLRNTLENKGNNVC